MQENIPVRKYSKEKVSKIKKVISIFLATIGGVILLSQGLPLISSYIQGEYQIFKQNLIKDPLPESYKQYIQDEFAYYDPGKSYFANLSESADSLEFQGLFTYDPTTKSRKEIIVNREYNKNMYINIPQIGIEDIRITANVESSDEKIYDQYLKYGLAHFKGTPLPGDGGNSFIYGHSAILTFFNKHANLPETIFTKLEDIDIGDTVLISKDSSELKYIVRNKRIVDPSDFSILKTQGDKETVTLMTCWPLGVGTKRLVVVAEKI